MNPPSILAVSAEGSATAEIVLMLFAAFTAAKVVGELAERVGIPSVVGELGAGILIGPSVLGWVRTEEFLVLLAELGVIVLLFQVGLGTRPAEMRAVGKTAAAVGVLGVALPFVLGFGVSLAADYDGTESAFVATALVATSVGITARVLADMGRLHTRESRIVLGAAVIDDILGLLVLAIVVGLAGGGSLSAGQIIVLLAEALGFVGALLVFGPRIMARVSHLLETPRTKRAPLAVAIVVLLGLSAAAEEVGLAAIVGAFLAGMLFGETSYQGQLERQFQPVADFLTPFFFVITGAQIDVESFSEPSVLGFAAVITVVAIVGKLAGGLAGARSLGRRSALIVGTGMVPRGEVGIVVASLGLSAGVVERDVFGAVLAMVVVTSLAAPIALKALFRGHEADLGEEAPAAAAGGAQGTSD